MIKTMNINQICKTYITYLEKFLSIEYDYTT